MSGYSLYELVILGVTTAAMLAPIAVVAVLDWKKAARKQ